MAIPGLTDIYQFSEWLKRSYVGTGRKPITITPIQGGLIQVEVPTLITVVEADMTFLDRQEVTDAEGITT